MEEIKKIKAFEMYFEACKDQKHQTSEIFDTFQKADKTQSIEEVNEFEISYAMAVLLTQFHSLAKCPILQLHKIPELSPTRFAILDLNRHSQKQFTSQIH